MFEILEIPVWAVWVAGLLAVIALLDRILMPSVRWYLRRRFNKAIERVNEHLSLKIQPFKLTKRRVLVDRLAHDPKVMEAVQDHVRDEGTPYEVAADMANRYAREIVPSFSAFAYFGFGMRFARIVSQTMYHIRIGSLKGGPLGALREDATVVFIMNHRSNVDYLLVTYLVSQHATMAYAVGEWARKFPLKQLVHSLGAYFIRRKPPNALYRRVLARYVQMASDGGVTQAIFPEGGLSRDGALKPAKLGLLNYIVSDFKSDGPRDVVFVPVGLNYDRVLEDRTLMAANGQDRARFKFKYRTIFRAMWRHFFQRLSGTYNKLGIASVSFGEPISLRDFQAGRTGDVTQALGETLMKHVGQVVPLVPAPIIGRVLVGVRATTIGRAVLVADVNALYTQMLKNGALCYIPAEEWDGAVTSALQEFELRKMLVPRGDVYEVAPHGRDVFEYYANSLAHLE